MAFLRHLILCDEILVPVTPGPSRKPTLHGIFQTIYAARFPTRHPSMALSVQASAPTGEHEVKLRLLDSSEKEILVPIPAGKVQVRDEILGILDINITLNGIPFEKPGIYTFEFSLDGQILGSRDFTVSEAPPPPKGMPPQHQPPGGPDFLTPPE